MSSPMRRWSIRWSVSASALRSSHAGLKHLLTAEGQQLAGEGGRASRRCTDFLHVRALAIPCGKFLEEQITESGDGREYVVEVMRDAAGEATHGLEALRLPELVFEGALLGYILSKTLYPVGLPGGSAHHPQAEADDDRSAVSASPGHLSRRDVAVLELPEQLRALVGIGVDLGD